MYFGNISRIPLARNYNRYHYSTLLSPKRQYHFPSFAHSNRGEITHYPCCFYNKIISAILPYSKNSKSALTLILINPTEIRSESSQINPSQQGITPEKSALNEHFFKLVLSHTCFSRKNLNARSAQSTNLTSRAPTLLGRVPTLLAEYQTKPYTSLALFYYRQLFLQSLNQSRFLDNPISRLLHQMCRRLIYIIRVKHPCI